MHIAGLVNQAMRITHWYCWSPIDGVKTNIYVKEEYQSTLQKNGRRESKVRYRWIHLYRIIQTMTNLCSIMPNLETHCHFKLDFKKWANLQKAND